MNDIGLLPAIGEYHVLSIEQAYPVVISTLGSVELADKLAKLKPKGVSIVGKTETENIGIEKVIKNVLAVASIKYILLCGKDSEGHYSGNTLRSLVKNGVDHQMRVINSQGKKPVLANTTQQEVEAFRNQIEIIDMIECEDIDSILGKVADILKSDIPSYNYGDNCCGEDRKKVTPKIEVIQAEEKDPHKVKLDKAGYFVIVPKAESKIILVEHYNNANQLLHVIKGEDARNIYWTIIENGWITELSHAAYLGKELTRAEMSINLGFKYNQDKA